MGSDPAGAATRVPRRRRGLIAAVAVLVLLIPAYSYATTMMQPSSLPLWPRSVEWLRAAPRQLAGRRGRALLLQLEGAGQGRPPADPPAEGRRRRSGGRGTGASLHRRPRGRRRSRRSSRTRCRAKASGADRPAGRRALAGAGDDLPQRARLPAHCRLCGVVRPHPHLGRLVPGPLRAAQRARARSDDGALRPALASARDLQRRLHLPGRQQRLVDQRALVRAAEGRAWRR